MKDWERWRTLLAVARHGAYARAARAIQVDATTIGRRIKALERSLGYELFIREGDRLHPTQKCKSILPQIEAAAEALRRIEVEPPGEEKGEVWREVRITAPPFLIAERLAPSLNSLVEDRRIKVELLGTDNKQLFSRRDADIAIRIEDEPTEEISVSHLIGAQKLGQITYAVYCATGGDVDELPWAGIVEGRQRTTGLEAQELLARTHGLRYRVHHFDALTELIASGSARAILPRVIGDADARLVAASDTVLSQPLCLLYHRQDEGIGFLDAAREWIVQAFRASGNYNCQGP